MNTIQRIAKNIRVLLVSQIASYILGFFFVMYTARYLGTEGFGILSFALASIGILWCFSDLGLNTLTVREVARDKSLASKYLGNIAVMKVILTDHINNKSFRIFRANDHSSLSDCFICYIRSVFTNVLLCISGL